MALATVQRDANGGVVLTVPGVPVPASRPRVSPRGIAYYAGPYKAFQKYLLDTIPPAAKTLMGDLLVEIECVCKPIAKSKFTTPQGDADNFAKSYMDALTKRGYYGDDRQIVDLHVIKRFPRKGEEPHAVVRLQEI